MSDELTLEVRKGKHFWFVTSQNPRGLLVVGTTRQDALEKVDGALRELAEAKEQAKLAGAPGS